MTTNLFSGVYAPVPNSFQEIAVTNAAVVTLTVPSSATLGKAKYVLLQAVTANINWRDDTVDPASTVGGGMVLISGDSPVGYAGNLANLRFISTASGGSTLLASFYY